MTLQNSLNSRRHSSSTPPVMPIPRRPYQRLTLYHHPSHETESLPLINPFYTVNMPFVSLLPIVRSCHHPALSQIPEKINMKPLRPNQEFRSPYPLHKCTFMRSQIFPCSLSIPTQMTSRLPEEVPVFDIDLLTTDASCLLNKHL